MLVDIWRNVSCDVLFQGPEFIQFLQQEYLPSLQVAPEISQVGHVHVELLSHRENLNADEEN